MVTILKTRDIARATAQNEKIVFQQMINRIAKNIEEESSYGEFSITFGFNNLMQKRLKPKIITYLEYCGYEVIDRDDRLIIEWY